MDELPGALRRTYYPCEGECGAVLELEGVELSLTVNRVTPQPMGAVMFLEGGYSLFWSDKPVAKKEAPRPAPVASGETGLAVRSQLEGAPHMFCNKCGMKLVLKMMVPGGGGLMGQAMSMFGFGKKDKGTK